MVISFMSVLTYMSGLEKEGAVGLLKGTGKGVASFFARPIGGLVDLTSGTLDVVTRYVALNQCPAYIYGLVHVRT